MNKSDTEGKGAGGAVDSNAANTRLTGSWLTITRAVWLVLVIPSLGFFLASLLVPTGELPVQMQQLLASIGISLSEFVALVTIFYAITAAVWYAVGFLIFWRRSNDWLALLAAFFLVMFNVTSLGNTGNALALAYPILALPLSIMSFLGLTSLLGFFLLFPTGRLVPRWMGLILLLVIINTFLSTFPSITSPFNTNWPGWLNLLVTLVVYGTIVFSQIYRYRRVSTPVQRQQTKWIVLGALVASGVVLGILALPFLFPSITNSNNLGATIFFLAIWPIALLLIPLSIGFSILRYRLYDIDVLINRTLVYGSLTALLALLYFGLIFALQSLFQGLVHQKNAVAIVVSTLVIAALFQPLRHRLQQFIDRRFYRRKYDVAKVVAAFSDTLRQEVDLDQLREHLLAVVQETMQPSHVSLWLRPPEHQEKQRAPWRSTPPPASSDGK